MKSLIVACLCLTASWTCAQEQTTWETYFYQMVEMEEIDETEAEDMYQLLTDLSLHPFPINAATRDDLLQIPFLSEKEVEDIMEYLEDYRPMKSLGELSMIESLSFFKRQLLTAFLTVDESDHAKTFPSLKNIAKYGKSELLLTGKIPFYKRAGDHQGYGGYPYRHDFRYTFSYGQRLKAGIVGAQDAGEPFFAKKNKWGYDYYSYFVMLKDMGRLKNLVVGKYRVGFGMGLVMNTNFSMGKTSMLTALGRTSSTLRTHASRSSANSLQGVATTVELANHLEATAFLSYQGIDGTESHGDTISNINKTGYHRTETELARKNNTHQFAAGTHLEYRYNGLHAGVSAYYSSLNCFLQPDSSQTYRHYYPSGKRFGNASINYGYTTGRFSFTGETAVNLASSSLPVATIHLATLRLADEWQLTALHRFYSKRYSSLFARSFSSGGRVQNESGLYVGLMWQPSRQLTLYTYFDGAYFPWPTYQASLASHAYEGFLSLIYATDPLTITCRYRYKTREKNLSDATGMAFANEHRGRISVATKQSRWNWKLQLDAAYQNTPLKSFGYMVGSDVSWQVAAPLMIYAHMAYFHTDDYNSRLYQYERGMLYAFSFPAYYGEGIRYALFLRSNLTRQLTLSAKIGTTNRFDVSSVGTGLQQVDSSSLTDLEVQIKWKF